MIRSLLMLTLLLAILSCSDDIADFTRLSCPAGGADDSQLVNGNVQRIHALSQTPSYGQVSARGGVTMQYAVYSKSNFNNKALLLNIAGGQLDTTSGSGVLFDSGSFVVRAAPLFAKQGYKVVVIQRPSDVSPSGTSGYLVDSYRTSSNHTLDLQAVIDAVNTESLPVVLVGNSRGVISAVAQSGISGVTALMLSSPVTSGKGSPLSESMVANSAALNLPVHLIWDRNDACSVSQPADSRRSLDFFNKATGVEVSGSYHQLQALSNPECKGATTHHGFSGIETCVVEASVSWLQEQL